MSRLRRFNLEFFKTTGSRNNEGKWVETIEPEPIRFKASVQPADSQTIQLLPEGIRKNSIFEIWTNKNLEIEPGQIIPGSKEGIGVILLNGEYYKVYKIMPWQNQVINHYVYAIARVNGK